MKNQTEEDAVNMKKSEAENKNLTGQCESEILKDRGKFLMSKVMILWFLDMNMLVVPKIRKGMEVVLKDQSREVLVNVLRIYHC